MPTTITINDWRNRTRGIRIDLQDPKRYIVTMEREQVRERADTGEVFERRPLRQLVQVVTFDAQDVPTGHAAVLALLGPMANAVGTLDAEAAAAEAGQQP